jgi:hypothetical protein
VLLRYCQYVPRGVPTHLQTYLKQTNKVAYKRPKNLTMVFSYFTLIGTYSIKKNTSYPKNFYSDL